MWVRRGTKEIAVAEAAASRKRVSLLGSIGIVAAVMVVMILGGLYGLPRFNARTGELAHIRSWHQRNVAALIAGSAIIGLATLPVVHLMRRQVARAPRSNALICVACHEPHPLGVASCGQCGGVVEPMDRWAWVEPSDPQAGPDRRDLG